MKSVSVSIDPSFTDFVDAQVKAGHYGSASDVVCAGLRLLEEQHRKRQALRDALIAGEVSGEPTPFDGEGFLQRMHTRHAQ